LFNVETLHEFLEQTLPPVTQGESEFYRNKELINTYNNDKDYQTSRVEPLMVKNTKEVMEPQLLFHQFCFLLGLIAKHTAIGDTYESKLKQFYEQELNLQRVLKQKDVTYQQILAKVTGNNDYFEENDEPREGSEGDEWGESSGSADEAEIIMANQQAILDLIEKKHQ